MTSVYIANNKNTLISYDEQIKTIKQYIKDKGIFLENLIKDDKSSLVYWRERETLATLARSSFRGTDIIVFNAFDIGRSIQQVTEFMQYCLRKGINIHFAQSKKIFLSQRIYNIKTLLEIIRTIENDIGAERCATGITKRRSLGLPIGRPKGRKNKTLRLDNYAKEIKKYLEAGIPKAEIARRLNCHAQTLYKFIKSKQWEEFYPQRTKRKKIATEQSIAS